MVGVREHLAFGQARDDQPRLVRLAEADRTDDVQVATVCRRVPGRDREAGRRGHFGGVRGRPGRDLRERLPGQRRIDVRGDGPVGCQDGQAAALADADVLDHVVKHVERDVDAGDADRASPVPDRHRETGHQDLASVDLVGERIQDVLVAGAQAAQVVVAIARLVVRDQHVAGDAARTPVVVRQVAPRGIVARLPRVRAVAAVVGAGFPAHPDAVEARTAGQDRAQLLVPGLARRRHARVELPGLAQRERARRRERRFEFVAHRRRVAFRDGAGGRRGLCLGQIDGQPGHDGDRGRDRGQAGAADVDEHAGLEGEAAHERPFAVDWSSRNWFSVSAAPGKPEGILMGSPSDSAGPDASTGAIITISRHFAAGGPCAHSGIGAAPAPW